MQTAELISTLIRAANAAGRMPCEELSDLLYQAIVAIVDLRKLAGIPATGTRRDAIIGLRDIANAPGLAAQQYSVALLDAVDMLRTLRILIDTGATVNFLESEMTE